MCVVLGVPGGFLDTRPNLVDSNPPGVGSRTVTPLVNITVSPCGSTFIEYDIGRLGTCI